MVARTSEQARVYEDLEARYGRLIADAFFAALDEIRSRAEIERIIAAYQIGDVEAALEALHLDPDVFDRMLDNIRSAHAEAGHATVGFLPTRRPDGSAVVIRFSGRNPEAEAWLSRHSSELVTRITDDQREAVRARLNAGLARGENPRNVALDVVGRINRATGKREGGVLGLTAAQEAYVRSAREELASGDDAALRHYLTRGRRDKRFDRTVEKAIREGRPLPAETVDKLVRAYSGRLLKLRGEMIARTETLASMHAASWLALKQAVEKGELQASQIRRIWRSARDGRVRDTHAVLDGESVGLDEAFTTPFGSRMLFPGDASQGAPASELIGCRCWCETRIDFFANLR